MDSLTITLVVLALVIAGSIAYFQYFFKRTDTKEIYLLFFLRSLSIFGLLILLINPKFNNKTFELVKPMLLVAIDNSSSISFTDQDSLIRSLANKFENSAEINTGFDVNYFTFGSSTNSGMSLNFQESKTNIYEVIDELNKLTNQQIAPIVLISDGNQTYGSAYKYFQSNQEIYPFIIGDTMQIADLEIDQVNVNSYSFLDNKFPVEVFLHYSGINKVKTKFTIESQQRIIFEQAVEFTNDKNNVHLQFNLPSNTVGKHLYKARLVPFSEEKNTINNIKNFSIEVIDEQTTIALVYDVMHPDIGMFKKSIEHNKQRKVELLNINSINTDELDYSAFILYQPNDKFESVFEFIKKNKANFLYVGGTSTDWNFINKHQDFLKFNFAPQFEKYYPVYNKEFNVFHVEDIGFTEFPALEGYFGEAKILVPNDNILTQFINGVDTKASLLTTFRMSGQRGGVLFGENIWKWRSYSYQLEKSFQKFDDFLNSIVQYLTIVKKANAIELEYKAFYYSDEEVKIRARVYDTNFNFNENTELHLELEKSPNKTPFYTNGNYFEVNLGALESGTYKFVVSDKQNKTKKEGEFTIITYSIEQEVTHSNKSDLKILAERSDGEIFYPNQFNEFVAYLNNNSKFKTVQKGKTIPVSLIDWKWILGIIIVSLILEWFIRKYRGLI